MPDIPSFSDLRHAVTDPFTNAAKDGVAAAIGGVWGVIVGQFSQAATGLIDKLMQEWPGIARVNYDEGGVHDIYAICTALGALAAVILLLVSIVRTQLSADGGHVSAALAGLAKATVAIAVTETVVQTGANASADICDWIVFKTSKDQESFTDKVKLVAANQSTPALTLVFSLAAIMTVMVLWAEILMVKLAIAVLVATSPIGASGLLSEQTSIWWQRQAMATFRLLLVPPSITLCFALGFSEVNQADSIDSTIVGLMTLAAAVLCWPALARFFAIDVDGQVSGGLGLLLGAAGNLGSRASNMGGGSSGGGDDPLDPMMLQKLGGAGGAGAGGAAGGAAGAAAG
ncbi:hypothetical protein, partial [Frankia sp. AiPa1]|uniref:hypothetical protein n=1 Tax=Frankia sp. AiPa1 TaxID=573492 RepID=UPI0035A85B72|nr:hypothetical protein [Frankia sp. AiPa1]